VDALLKTFTTNAIGALLVIQAYLPLLKKSSIPSLPPRVINISSAAGSISFAAPLVKFFGAGFDTAYNLSKASLNYITTAFAGSEPSIIFVAVSPGWVATEMGYGGAPVTTEGSAEAIRAHVEKYTKENSGQFRDIISGELLPL
jgi:NAD(P)-dependent dehydrogenase (short-subunit alcohol dehydrogenase family)